MASLFRYRFGNAVFDESTFELTVAGVRVEAQPLPLKILALLLARRGQVVARQELFQTVWHGRPTVDNVLPNAITKLRNALGETDAAMIENVPRVGYRFTGEVERVPVLEIAPTMLRLEARMPVPGRPEFTLQERLHVGIDRQVWLASSAEGARRVFKFASSLGAAAVLRRELAISQVLADALGARQDIAAVTGWSFTETSQSIDSAYGGEDLLRWSKHSGQFAAMSAAERMDLVMQIVAAAAAAHGVGVIHGDLKPANVLIDTSSGKLQVRLADFGSGRVLETERLLRLGLSLGAGSPTQDPFDSDRGSVLYLAPEVFQEQRATLRSDVYAMGVLVYQIITGNLLRPLGQGWESEVPDELLREDITVAVSARPEDRLASVEILADRLRRLPERRIELEQRREAARQAASDHEAVRRARLRRPWLIGLVTSLAAGLTASLILYARVLDSRAVEERELSTVRALNGFFVKNFVAQANPLLTGRQDLSVIDAARAAAAHIDETFADADPFVRGQVHASMQATFEGLDEFSAALDQGRKALVDLDRADAVLPALLVRLAMAREWTFTAHWKEAREVLDQIQPQIEPYRSSDPPVFASYLAARAGVNYETMVLPEAVSGFTEAWTIASQSKGFDADQLDSIEYRLADTLRMSGRYEDAQSHLAQLSDRQLKRRGSADPGYCQTRVVLASTLGYMRKFEQAVPIASQAKSCIGQRLGPLSLRTAAADQVLADLYFEMSRYREAAAAYGEVVDAYAQIVGPEAPRTVSMISNEAVARQYSGDAPAAEALLRIALERSRKKSSWDDPVVQGLRYHLADCRLDLHRTDEVAQLLDGLDPATLNEAQQENDWVGHLAYQAGRLALYSGKPNVAAPLFDQAAALIAAKDPDGQISESKIRELAATARASR